MKHNLSSHFLLHKCSVTCRFIMTKAERIEALEIASKYEIKTVLSWWNPFQNVQWSVLKSRKKLTDKQYYYLSNNKLLEVKSEPKKGEEVILAISNVGREKLLSLKNGR